MKDLDIKSLIIGFLTASVVGLVVVLIQPKEETKENEVGRYVSPTPSGILDTVTGTMWSYEYPPMALKEQYKGYTNTYNVKMTLPKK